MSEHDIELEQLRSKANELGIHYHHRAGAEKIRGLIAAHVEQGNVAEAIVVAEEEKKEERENVTALSSTQYREKNKGSKRNQVAALVRVRIQCMNPQKSNWEGEIISVGSAKLGTFKRYVPFNNVEWHIPKIIYDMMKERKCSIFYTKRNDLGHKVRHSRLIDEFSIEVLPPLSAKELSDLARVQAARAGQGNP